jgi:coenzyme F420-reducing hydrogenase delta subunit
VKTLLEEIGLEGDRVRMYNLSSGEGPTFVAYANEMTDLIRSLGPNPLNQRKHGKEG